MTDQEPNLAQMKSDATREYNLIQFQNANLTTYVKKCFNLVERFKEEYNQSSSLLLHQAATEVMTFYNWAKDQLEALEGSMNKFFNLTSQTQQGNNWGLIGDLQVDVEVYSQSFEDIKGKNIKIF